MIETWHHGSAGNAYPYISGLHHARRKALEASGYVEWREAPFNSKRLHLTDAGRRWLLESGHLPDPGAQWAQMRAIWSGLAKIVGLHGGWSLYSRQVMPTLPHPWRFVVALTNASWADDYRKLSMDGAFEYAIQACDGIAAGDEYQAWRHAILLRNMLEGLRAKPLTKRQREDYRYACEHMMNIEREALPPEPPAEVTQTA
jgi:hypothetical protein